MNRLSLIGLFLSAFVWMQAQDQPTLEYLTTKDGLSQGMIYDILKDRDGFMWFATKNGLNRYDGYEFLVFTHNPFDSLSISGDEIFRLFEDAEGRLWVGTKANGLNLFDRKKQQFYRLGMHNSVNVDLTGTTINTIIEDSDGSIWIGTDKGIFSIEVVQKKKGEAPFFKVSQKTIESGGEHRVASLFRTADGNILAKLFFGGLFYWNASQKQFENVLSDNTMNSDGGKSILEYPYGTYWISFSKGRLFKYRSETDFEQVFSADGSQILYTGDLVFDNNTDKIWYCQLFNNTIYSIDPNLPIGEITQEPVLYLSPRTYPTDLLFDDNQTLWIGTNGYGIRKLAVNAQPFLHLAKGQSTTFIAQINDYLFYSDRFMYLIADGTDHSQFISDQIPVTNELRGLYQAKNGKIWALSRPYEDDPKVAKLFRLSANFEHEVQFWVENVNPQYGLIQEDALGNLWLPGDLVDFVRFDVKTGASQPFNCNELGKFPAFNTAYVCFYKDGEGVFWKGSSSGLLRMELDKQGNPVNCEVFQNNPTDLKSLSNNSVSVCLDDPIDPHRFMWVGTKGGGLNKMDKQNGTFEHFTMEDGLPDDVVYGILTDGEQKLWLSTNKGLAQFDPTTGDSRHFRAADGLQDDEFNTTAFFKNEKTGHLYFGGINGITAFDPGAIELDRFQPPVYISHLKINGEEVIVGKPLKDKGKNPLQEDIAQTERIDLAWHQNQLTLGFVALDFSIPEKNLYQYRLSGVNKDWVDAGTDRSVNFGNLAPGTYLFEVKGSNSSGVWSEKPAQLLIVIHPPWWQTTWAYALYLLAFLGSVLTLYRFQLNRNRLKNQLAYEQKEAERLAQLDRLKTNFFSNITHEFRTPLTLILEPVRQMLQKDLAQKDLVRIEEKLRLVQNNGDRLLLMVNQLLDLSKLEGGQMALDIRTGDIVEIIRPIFESFLPLAEQKEIVLNWKVEKGIPICNFDKDKLEKVIANLLSNAIKFTDTGSCTLEITYEAMREGTSAIVIQVSDSGIGISEKDQTRIFDRFYQVDDSSTRKEAGTGIGLALTRELVELMGGKICVQSELQKGTTFRVWLPAFSESGQFAQPAHTSDLTEVAQSSVVDNGTVADSYRQTLGNSKANNQKETPVPLLLLVEDNPELRLFLKQSLEQQFQVVEAANGQEGIEKGIELIPDLIISDLMMPVKNGYELTDVLKGNEKTSHIPIILLTAKTTVESQIKGLQHGADVYLTKPFNTEVLLAYVYNLIEQRRNLHEKYLNQELQPIEEKLKIFEPQENQFLQKLHKVLEEQIDNPELSADELSRKMLMSRSQLHRKIKALTNQHTTEFIRSYRLDRAMELLKGQKGNVTEIAFQVGFASQKYFSKRFKERFGQTPSEVS